MGIDVFLDVDSYLFVQDQAIVISVFVKCAMRDDLVVAYFMYWLVALLAVRVLSIFRYPVERPPVHFRVGSYFARFAVLNDGRGGSVDYA